MGWGLSGRVLFDLRRDVYTDDQLLSGRQGQIGSANLIGKANCILASDVLRVIGF